MNGARAWTRDEDNTLRLHWYGGYRTAGRFFPDRSEKAVQARAWKLGLTASQRIARKGMKWTRLQPYAQTDHERRLAAFLSAPRVAA